MKKGVLLLVFLIVVIGLLSTFVIATNHTTSNTTSANSTSTSTTGRTNTPTTTSAASSNSLADFDDAVDKGYQCLEDKIEASTKLSLQEAIFSGLALGINGKIETTINSEKRTDAECWPKAGCKVKETAQVMLAYQKSGKSTSNIEKWLTSRNGSATELQWYLQVDIVNHVPAGCTVKYDEREFRVRVNDNMKIEGSAGTCLSVSSSGYWLAIKDSCLNRVYEVSCDQDFVTNLLYEKTTGGTIYVSSETHSASNLGLTTEQVKAKCFKSGTTCDYEGTLWAATALSKKGYDIDDYIPYLVALSEENKRFFPSALIYATVGGEDQYSTLIQSQKNSKYWDIVGSPYNIYYDTSIAMLALAGEASVELENTQAYLVGIQGKDGCWNSGNIRDTAFILYSGWPKGTRGSGGSSGNLFCESANSAYSCERKSDCDAAGGRVDYSLECPSLEFCCSVKAQQQTCSEKGGTVCASNQQCSGSVASSADGSCCVTGSCQNIEVTNACETISEGSCRTSCLDGEEEASSSCGDSTLCCVPSTEIEEKSNLWIWIVILTILIILIVLAIIFRDKIRLWWFRFRGTAKTTPVTRPSPPGFGTAITRRPFGMIGGMPPQTSRPIQRPVNRVPLGRENPRSQRDKELEDTLKELKRISE